MAASTIARRVYAAAEVLQTQEEINMGHVVDYVRKLTAAGRIRNSTFVEHCAYDETQLAVRVVWSDSEPSKESVKMFVVEHQWAVVLEFVEPDGRLTYMTLRGLFSPCVRAGSSTSGEGVHAVLKTTHQVPARIISETFTNVVRLTETDEAGGNTRCERMILEDRGDKWSTLHCVCLAHKLHACCTRSWVMTPSLITGIIQTGLYISEAGSGRKLRSAARRVVKSKLVRIVCGCQCDASIEFRTQMTDFYEPTHSHPKRLALYRLVVSLLNGDWRRTDRIEHYCSESCCTSTEESVEKVGDLLGKLLCTMRCGVMSKANWHSWIESVHYFGFGAAAHNVLSLVFNDAFGHVADRTDGATQRKNTLLAIQSAVDDAEAGLEVELHAFAGGEQHGPEVVTTDSLGDELHKQRQERLKTEQAALHFMSKRHHADLYLLASSLHGEVSAMRALLHATSGESELQRWHVRQTGIGDDRPPIVKWLCGDFLRSWFDDLRDSFGQLHSTLLAPHTEIFRTDVLRLFFRPAAVAAQLIIPRLHSYPGKVFQLLVCATEDLESTAQGILDDSTC
eukprot:6492463-Amphidinium_carterae.1